MRFPAEVPYTAALAAAKALKAGDTVTALDEGLYAAGCLNSLRASGSGWNQGPKAALGELDDDALANEITNEFAAPPEGAQAAGIGTGIMSQLISMLIQRLLERLLSGNTPKEPTPTPTPQP